MNVRIGRTRQEYDMNFVRPIAAVAAATAAAAARTQQVIALYFALRKILSSCRRQNAKIKKLYMYDVDILFVRDTNNVHPCTHNIKK